MRWLCLAMCLAAAQAHVPVFDNDLMEADVTDKSWGVYLDMKKDDSFKVYLNVKQGENISFSINLAGSQADNSVGNYTRTTIWGHNANLINCSESFTGWGEERSERSSRRLGEDVHPPDSTRLIPYDPDPKLFFEPFGVGFYKMLSACEAPAPYTDRFELTVTALRDAKISIGVGMAESFTPEEIIMMPFTIFRVWQWDNYLDIWLGVTGFLLALSIFVMCFPIFRKTQLSTAQLSTAQLVIIIGFGFSILHFTVRLIYLHALDYEEKRTDNMWISWMLHVVAPLLVAVLCLFPWKINFVQQPLCCNIIVDARVFLFLYGAALLWQGFHIVTLFYLGYVLFYIAYADLWCYGKCCNANMRTIHRYEIVEIKQVTTAVATV